MRTFGLCLRSPLATSSLLQRKELLRWHYCHQFMVCFESTALHENTQPTEETNLLLAKDIAFLLLFPSCHCNGTFGLRYGFQNQWWRTHWAIPTGHAWTEETSSWSFMSLFLSGFKLAHFCERTITCALLLISGMKSKSFPFKRT
jgi:hypothetical protein